MGEGAVEGLCTGRVLPHRPARSAHPTIPGRRGWSVYPPTRRRAPLTLSHTRTNRTADRTTIPTISSRTHRPISPPIWIGNKITRILHPNHHPTCPWYSRVSTPRRSARRSVETRRRVNGCGSRPGLGSSRLFLRTSPGMPTLRTLCRKWRPGSSGLSRPLPSPGRSQGGSGRSRLTRPAPPGERRAQHLIAHQQLSAMQSRRRFGLRRRLPGFRTIARPRPRIAETSSNASRNSPRCTANHSCCAPPAG